MHENYTEQAFDENLACKYDEALSRLRVGNGFPEGVVLKYLLTGGAGFIGHHLTQYLLKKGCEVYVVDNLSTGRTANIQRFQNHPRYHFIQGNAQDVALMRPLVQEVDCIFNLAAAVGVKKIVQEPIKSIENNIFVASNMLSLADEYDKRIIMFSTSEVYGKMQKFPFEESDDVIIGSCDKIRWNYAASKMLDDFLSRAYFVETGLKVTMIRLFNTIGQGQVGNYGMVVPRFFDQAMAGKPITIYGNGEQSRCFTDVRDVVHILDLIVGNELTHGELINIGSNSEISINGLAKQIKAICHSNSLIDYQSYEEGYGKNFEDMERRVPSQEKLIKMTGYRMKYDLMATLSWIYEEKIAGSRINIDATVL